MEKLLNRYYTLEKQLSKTYTAETAKEMVEIEKTINSILNGQSQQEINKAVNELTSLNIEIVETEKELNKLKVKKIICENKINLLLNTKENARS